MIKIKTKSAAYFRKKVFGLPRPLWILLQWLFVLSGTVMTLTASLRGSAAAGFCGLALSFILCAWLVFYRRMLESTVSGFSWICGLIALPYAAAAAGIFMDYFYFRFEKLAGIALAFAEKNLGSDPAALGACLPAVKTLMTVFTGLALWMAAYHLFNGFRTRVLPVLRGFSGAEIAFWAAAGIISAVLVILVYRHTGLFSQPVLNGLPVKYDAVFTSDTGILMQTDVFVNINAGENDLRHPLFGLFAMPFGITASWIARLFSDQPAGYALALAVLQVLALLFSMILLSRLTGMGEMDRISFLLLYFIAFPVLLFILNIEQYIFALFWLSLYLYAEYAGFREPPDRLAAAERDAREAEGWREAAFAGAAGSLLPGGLLLLFCAGKDLKQGLLRMAKAGFAFLAFVTAFGQFPVFADAAQMLRSLSRFAGTGMDAAEKIRQYTVFIRSCFVAPAAGLSNAYDHVSWQLLSADRADAVGILLLVLAAAGFWLNRKDRYCRLCFGWLLFSFCLLGLAGWGALENGMILYSLYFSWAILTLVHKGICRLLAGRPFVRLGLFAVLFLVMAAVNIRALREVILFGMTNYPG